MSELIVLPGSSVVERVAVKVMNFKKDKSHREVHSELQLSREIGIEKSGEFREA